MTANMELLAHRVKKWAKERGLDNPNNSTAQALKLFEEAGELAHHVNEDKLDNSPENIELMSFSEHSRLHAKEKWEERGGFVTI